MTTDSDIEYIEPEDLINIVDIIRSFEYEHQEEIPDYDNERDSIDEYFALIDRSKMVYYPSVLDKASFLFININSHYFSNGNKRLSVVSTVYFLEKNNYLPGNVTKAEYRIILDSLFGDNDLSDWKGFEAKDFGLYNLAVIVAKHNEPESMDLSSDELKNKVKEFFKKTFILN